MDALKNGAIYGLGTFVGKCMYDVMVYHRVDFGRAIFLGLVAGVSIAVWRHFKPAR